MNEHLALRPTVDDQSCVIERAEGPEPVSIARPGRALAVAALGFFVVTLDALVVNVALPAIGRDLGGGMSRLQWVVDGYTLMATGLLSICVAAADAPICLLSMLTISVGLGASLSIPTMTALLMGSVPAERAGTASGVLNTSRQLGGALAVAIFGALVAQRETFLHSMQVSLVSAAVLLLATAAACLSLQTASPAHGHRHVDPQPHR